MVKPLPILLGNVPGKCIRVNVVMGTRPFHDIKGRVVADSTSEKKSSCSTEILVTVLSV
jgi:hypothetical protein